MQMLSLEFPNCNRIRTQLDVDQRRLVLMRKSTRHDNDLRLLDDLIKESCY
jgi:hypothetical protein